MEQKMEGHSLSEVLKPLDGSLGTYQNASGNKSSISNNKYDKTKTAEFQVNSDPNGLEYEGKQLRDSKIIVKK